MKSKFVKRSSTKEGPTISEVYSGAVVKGGPKRKVVKLTKTNLVTDNDARKTYGGGEKIKKVYKNGVLTNERRKKLSANKIIRKGLI